MACIYTVKGKEYSEAEFKKYLVDNLKDLVENDKFIDLGITKENVPGKGEKKPLNKFDKARKELDEAKDTIYKFFDVDPTDTTQKSGIGKKELVDAIHKAVRSAIDAGENVHDVIESIIEKLKKSPTFTDKHESIIREAAKDEQEKKYEGDDEMTKMANAINDSFIEGKFGTEAMDNVIKGLQDTDVKNIYEKAKKGIEDGVIDTKKVRDRVIDTRTGSELDQATLLYDMAQLKGKERNLTNEIIKETDEVKKQELQRDLVDVQNDMIDNTVASRLVGRGASTIFRIRKVWADKDANLADMVEQYKASKGLKDITPEERAEIVKSYEKLRDLENKIKDLEKTEVERKAEVDRLNAENDVLKKLLKEAKEQKKKDRSKKSSEVIKDANARIQKAKDRIREITKGNLSSGVNPEIAIELAKIAKEQIVKGVVKLDEIVRNVLDEIKDVLPHFTEQDVKDHLAYTKESKPQSETSKIGGLIKRTLKTEEKTAKGDFEPKERKVYEESEKLKEARRQYAIEKFKWEKARRLDLLSKRPIGEKIMDSVIRWQRFSVLSYPSTLLKLASVVGHGLLLKPVTFAVQTGLAKIMPKIFNKADVWSKPNPKALAQYYNSFIKNFTLATLKEHFTGVDALETQYGKPFIYDEWNLGKGILEMPGRSHGYIKSFIKRPEFDYAHTQVLENYAGKMIDIQEKLKDPHISEKDKAQLQTDYARYDLTNPEVVDQANKLALEHGKWAILMNDSKGIAKLRSVLDDKSFPGYLLKTELPIVKIPLNFIGRSIATKYGLLRAVTGKHDFISGEHKQGLIELAVKGTENLTPEEANLISRSLTIGTMGATLFALGYLNKSNMKEEKDGSWKMFGQHIPKTLLHTPLFESAFSGALTGQKYEKEGKKNSWEWIKDFVESDIDVVKNNPFSDMLKYGAVGNLMSLMNSNREGDKAEISASKIVAKKISDLITPGALKELAKATDPKEKRKSKTWFDEFLLGIPGAREQVK